MFAFHLMSLWICARDLLHPRALAHWIGDSAAADLMRKFLTPSAFDDLPALGEVED
jgi:hypothetical protein